MTAFEAYSTRRRWPSQRASSGNNNSLREQNNSEVKLTVDGIRIRKIYVNNINILVQRQDVYDIFGPYGPIMNIFLGISKNDTSKQFAFITYADPKDAARVMNRRKFQDAIGSFMYVSAADSWHQPKEGPNGEILWNRRAQVTPKEGSDNYDHAAGAVGGIVGPMEVNKGLNLLNDDCLLHIFSFLSYKEMTGVERVCKRWQALSFRKWRCLHEISFTAPPFNEMKANSETLEQCLKRCGEGLSLLDLVNNTKYAFNESTVAMIAKYCSNLETLRVASIFLGNRSLAHLARSCPKLKRLSMDSCLYFNDKDLMSLLPKCHELCHLDLIHANGIVGKCLLNIEGPIKSLRLCNCSALEIKYLIAGLQKMSNTLQCLKLSACAKLGSNDVNMIVSAVPNLTDFSLCNCFLQIDMASLVLVGQLTKLTTLNLNQNYAVNDNALSAIIEGCTHLTRIYLSGSGGGCAGVLSEQGLSRLGRMRNLTHVDISYQEAANNVVLQNLSARLIRLKQLLVRGCPYISDVGSMQVVSVCNDLELFDLSGCDNVTVKTISSAVTSIKIRTNNVHLKLIIGGTCIQEHEIPVTPNKEFPLLTIDTTDFSENHLRPDFIEEMFFPPSESDDEDHLECLCWECDYDFDDMYSPNYCCDFDDDPTNFGAFGDSDDST